MAMNKREFGEPIKKYIIEEDRLAMLLEMEHRFAARKYNDEREYFYRALVESGDVEKLTYREFTKLMDEMTFEKLAEMDLELYEELEEQV